MIRFPKNLLCSIWRYCTSRNSYASRHRDLDIGFQVRDEQAIRTYLTIPNNRRAEHIGILGKTGTGKSSLLRCLLKQDIAAGRGFVCFDLHGDLTGFVLRTVAAQEKILRRDLSDKV